MEKRWESSLTPWGAVGKKVQNPHEEEKGESQAEQFPNEYDRYRNAENRSAVNEHYLDVGPTVLQMSHIIFVQEIVKMC